MLQDVTNKSSEVGFHKAKKKERKKEKSCRRWTENFSTHCIFTIHSSSNLDKYVQGQIYSKQQESNKCSKDDNAEPIHYNELVIDFRVRWNSTFKMSYQFNALSSILNDGTFTSKNIDDMDSQQMLKLSKLAFSHEDWN